jgi:hypothetical protein
MGEKKMKTKIQFVEVLVFIILGVTVLVNAANLVANPGFETGESISGGLPTVVNDWKGDYSAVTGSTLGITPNSGSQMLQFLGSSYIGCGGSATTCDVFQLIDLSGYNSLIVSGKAKAIASAYFNRVMGDSQTDTKFDVIIYAYDGSPNTFSSRYTKYGLASALVYSHTPLYADGLISTWEKSETILDLPSNTTFLALCINIHENIYNDSSYPEYDGHFADDVSLTIIPEPATILLLGMGAFGLIRRK